MNEDKITDWTETEIHIEDEHVEELEQRVADLEHEAEENKLSISGAIGVVVGIVFVLIVLSYLGKL